MKLVFLVVGFSLAAIVLIVPSVQKVKEIEKKALVFIGDQIIYADVADTVLKKRKGLAGRSYMGVNEGMLFTFKETGYYSFWMKGMRIPIDVVWISDGKIVGFEERVMPEEDKNDSELTLYRSPQPIDAFLEIRGGRIDILDAEIGDMVEVKRVIPNEGKLINQIVTFLLQ
jgi:uncharacterized protein